MILVVRRAHRFRYFLLSTATVVVSVFITSPAIAQDNSSIAQGFKTTDTNITAAALVGVEKTADNSIELSSAQKSDKLIGIVSDRPLIELSNGASSVQVVVSGLTMALVSDINGTISSGDKITASPIEGVGMKARESTTIVGTAQADLKSVDTQSRSVTISEGKKKTVKIGLIPVQVTVASYTAPSVESAFVPGFLQSLANNITGRNVSPIRVLVAALILLLLFVSVTVLLYSAVRSSIISIGRNPLSETAVRKSLLEVGLTVTIVMLLAILVIYLVLTV